LDYTSIANEYSVLESAQVCLLLLSLIITIYTALDREREDKIISIVLSIALFGILLREIDIEDFNIPMWVIAIGSGSGRTLLLSLMLVPILLFMVVKHHEYYGLVKKYFMSQVGLSLILSFCLLLIGSLFEHEYLLSRTLIEESFELIAYGLFFRGVFIMFQSEIKA
jgi:hypothetical protein